jgi:hypothetical protein
MAGKAKTPLSEPAKPKRRAVGRVAEFQREQLLGRLSKLSENSKRQPAYRTAFRLLRNRYDVAGPKAKLELLKVAAFMIWVLERTLT